MNIKLLINNKELRAKLENNQASREFYAQLPLELKFSDFANKEKIAHLPTPLNTKGNILYKPQIGDLFYYVPWGNIGIFYESQIPNNHLVFLGRIQDDLDSIKTQKTDFKIKITKE
ncbi:TPA: hypothetical protein R1737_000030 [Campylobacter lari]|uniref:cyclophilin-like fold protein n=1 Tax=Campylobacter lari TaxID=201 RepID=UPI0027E4E4BF|nr:cyclophilin-like fold protein [Campylobacter lari]HEC1782001.1 hypothetical protein [Campylobacter lari]